MQTLSPTHPIRCFQIDPMFGRKLEVMRARLAAGRVNPATGLREVAFDYGVPDEVEAFPDLLGYNRQYLATGEQFTQFLRFWDGERQIFSVDPALASALAHTDAGDVPWEALRLPYDLFHVSFGTVLSEELEFGGRRYKVDGAYVHRFSGTSIPELRGRAALRLTVTTRLINMPPEAARGEMPEWMSLTEPTYDWYLFGEPGDCLADCFGRGLEASLSMERRRDRNNYEQSQAINADLGLPGDTGGPGTQFEDKFNRGRPLIEEAVPLVVNLIFYLVHCAPTAEIRYPPEAPAGLADKIERAPTEKRRRILTEEMERMGFTRVRFVSEAGLAEDRLATGTGASVRSHWRRGHWRMQPHGPGLSLVKLLWIRPVLVNASAPEGPATGRIYEVPVE